MRSIITILIVAMSFWAADAFAFYHNCGGKKSRAQAKTTVATPEENDYDIVSLEFDINLSNTSSTVSGSVTTHANTLISNFTVYAFELDAAIDIDSVLINGQNLGVVSNRFSKKSNIT